LRVYASVYNPDVLLYRKQQKVLDFDERMAICRWCWQLGTSIFPRRAYSRNPLSGIPLRRKMVSWLVTGLGTRWAPRDYPRMVALSHPNLRPRADQEIKYYPSTSWMSST
jgi:hypothetical protein